MTGTQPELIAESVTGVVPGIDKKGVNIHINNF